MLPDKLDGVLQLHSVSNFLTRWIPELCSLLRDHKLNICFLQPVPFWYSTY